MSVSICQYSTKKVSSNRTHVSTIDVIFDDNRIFISDEQAVELIGKMSVALATKMEDPNGHK